MDGTPIPPAPRIAVVGVDGSAESLSALRWAAGYAGPDGTVHVLHSSTTYDTISPEFEAQWIEEAAAHCGNVIVELTPVDTAPALLGVADDVDADIIVVGLRHRVVRAPTALGRSVSKLVQQTTLPLALVPAGPDTSLGPASTIVVGVGHGPATRAAVDFAADTADAHHTSLTLITAVPHRPVFGTDGLLDVMAFFVDPGLLRQWATEDLGKLAARIQASTVDDVEITAEVPIGSAGQQLVAASREATLLVVGRHQDGAIGEKVVPPSVHHALTHAPCPVVVVPPAPDIEPV